MSKRLIILEGPDGSGKTTLANKLADYYRDEGRDVVVVHSGPPDAGSKEILPTMLYHAIDKFKDFGVVIMDRSPLSELIYGTHLRGEVKGTHAEWLAWNEVLDKKTSFKVDLFVLDAADETLLHRAYCERGEDFVPPEKFFPIVNAYRDERLVDSRWTRLMTDVAPD